MYRKQQLIVPFRGDICRSSSSSIICSPSIAPTMEATLTAASTTFEKCYLC